VRRDLDPALWFEDLIVLAELVAGAAQVSGVSKDPDDDKYLAAAVEGRAAFLVTGDPHLLAIRQYAGVRIVSPRAFLDFLGS
jgi:predicted nucleic acid-binding protein